MMILRNDNAAEIVEMDNDGVYKVAQVIITGYVYQDYNNTSNESPVNNAKCVILGLKVNKLIVVLVIKWNM